ncbi:ABC transporter permease [Fulvivirga sedimenti]|uniref:ABC transporter permease n=1 Tax=Fulvivirga sedimenti TaxID=2879465 RepID=A0A9X1HPA3_9BACT|nr:ABC transporter permease [Fulvivirga sedimenti]MCA6074277.1 ABC transporter permease [Fulvivirga sedimenti]
MFLRFLSTAWRNIVKHKVFSVINFIGLSIGIALTVLIFIYVREEVNYDRFQSKLDRIYRIKYSLPSQNMELASSPPPIAPRLPEYFSDVESVARLFGRSASIKRSGSSEIYEEESVYFADTTFLNIFDLEFIQGSPDEAFRENTVLLTDVTATKYFGAENPIGQSLNFSGRIDFEVVGVVKEYPSNSSIHFSMLLPYENMFDLEEDQTSAIMRQNLERNFVISHSFTYILLKEGSDPSAIDKGMDDFMKEFAPEQMQVGQVFTLFPLKDIHMESTLLAEPEATNSWSTIYLFIAVSLLTLAIASINYINLSTAQSFSRVKEIGVRKVMGSDKRQLIFQFLTEAFLFVGVSVLVALFLVNLSIPILNDLTNKNFIFSEVMDGQLILLLLALILILTVLAGSYPAFFVTGFNTVNALKGSKLQATGGGKLLRRSLVGFQLLVTSFLLVAALIILQQLNFINNKALGFDKERIVMISLFSQNLNNIFSGTDTTFQTRLKTYADELKSQSFIGSSTRLSSEVGSGISFRGTVPEGFTPEDNMFHANLKIDYDFFETFEIEIVAGRPLSQEYASDATEGFMVNETAVREYGWGNPQDAIGKTFNLEGKIGTVVGVMKDFHFMGLTQPLTPLSADISAFGSPLLAVKVIGDDLPGAISFMEDTWNELFPEKTFEYSMLDESLANQYEAYKDFGMIIGYFTLIAIVISCMGLYGMILYNVQRRQKEIGIKKVLGANVGLILSQMYKEFLILVIVGFLLAIPLSYYAVSDWLDSFVYSIEISPVEYLIGLVIIVVLVFATISRTALVAALSNPIDAIRSE